MAVNSVELKKAMDTLGISDIHIDREQAKKIYKKLLIKWHPDACPDGDERYYNEVSARINAAYEIIEKAYDEGLMGPKAKSAGTESYTYNERPRYSSNTNSSSSNHSEQNSHESNAGSKSRTGNKRQYTYYDDYDKPDGWDVIYYRKRWLNVVFLTICTIYIVNAIIKSPVTDIYIEKSVIYLILLVTNYYAIYWFCKFFSYDIGFLVSGIAAWILNKVMTFILTFVYNKFGIDHEWLAMLLFIAAFFAAEYFIHIRKIIHSLCRKIKLSKITTFLSYIMLLEYAVMLVFGIYSVILVHRLEAIRNTIIPPWY